MARKKVQDQGEELNMDMSPMIDCVFLLLIFFIVVSTQTVVQQDPNVKPTIASASQEPEQALRRIVVNIFKKDGTVKYTDEGTKEIPKEELQEHIKAEIERLGGSADSPCTLHLRADRFLPWRDIQVVQAAAAKAGILDVNFASFQQNP